MNENIKHYLFRYTENPDPQYAVMLKGKWGCGKTHFVNKWISEYTAQQKAGQYVISPIYVSLYGLNSTKQITKAIDKVLHPLLYSKGAEFTKKLFKIAGKVVLKTSLDWNGDAKEDASFEAALDSLSILSSKDSDIKGAKLIIFDDIERCMVDMKELLGFINAFVEHASCHVILVGDDTHLKEISKKTLAEFSEKTVGREFEILPDIDAAIDVFLHKDLPLVDWIRGQKALIVDIFRATRCNNLRILRQCLYDFSNMLGELEIELNSKFSKILSGLLASYIVLYCEYKGCNADLIKSWNTSYMSGLMGHENDKQRISDLQNKYNYITNKYQIYVFNENHIPEIVNEIERGITPTDYVQKLLEYSLQEITIQDRLADFFKLDLSDFTTLCSQLIEDLINENIANNYLYGRSLALLSFFEREKMFELPEDFVSFTKGHIKKSFDDVNDQETLYQCKKEYQMGFQSFMQMERV